MSKQGKFSPSFIFILFLILLALTNYSCKDNSVDPEENQPGRRDYVWSVDTLKVPEGLALPSWMWAYRSNDIWISGMAYRNGYCVWHYNGNSWTNYDPAVYWDPRGMYGTSSNNIWMGSTDGTFWHYDGSEWSKFCQTHIPDYQPFVAQGMCGSSPDNIYSVGYADSIDGTSYKAIIMHFDGSEWKQVDIPVIHNSFTHIVYDKASGNFFIKGWIFDKADEFIYSFDGQELTIIFSAELGFGNIVVINDNIYISQNANILKFTGDSFTLMAQFDPNRFITLIGGRSETDILTANFDGLGHYNGSDLVTIYKKPNYDWSYSGLIKVFERDVFAVCEDSHNTFIVHGQLRN